MAAISLIFDLLVRDKGASRAFDDVGDAAERAGKKGGGAGSAISSGMKLAAGALLGGGLIAGFKSLYEAAAESAKITALTEQVIKSTGGAAQVTAKQVGDLVGAISDKTGVDDEAIQSGANLLLTFTNLRNQAGEGNDIFTQTTQIMTDMSVALGTDASGSAIQLGKALNDPIKGIAALSRVGVSFTEQQKEQIRVLVESGDVMGAQKIILAELGKEFGGAAEAAATPLDRLKVTVGNLQEEIGAYLIPVVDKVARFFMEDFLPAARDVGGVLKDTLIPAFQAIGPVLAGAVNAIGVIATGFGALPGPVQAAALAMGAFLLLRVPLTAMLVAMEVKLVLAAVAAIGAVGSLGALRVAVTGLITSLGPATLAVGLLAFAVAGFLADQAEVEARLDSARDAGREFNSVLAEQGGRLNSATLQATSLAVETLGLSDAFDDANVSMRTVTDALAGNKVAYDEALAAAEKLDEQQLFSQGIWGSTGVLMDLVSGKATENADAFRNAAGQSGDYFITLGNVDAGGFGEWAERTRAATDAAGGAAETAAVQTSTLAVGMEAAAAAADLARQETDFFRDALNQLTGANVSMIETEIAYERALAAGQTALEGMNGAVLEGAGDLNEQSTAGQAAAETLFTVRDRADALITKMKEQGATSQEVLAKDAELRAGFIRTANQMGITGHDAELLADSIYGIPGKRETVISADTAPAMSAVNAFIAKVTGTTITMTGNFSARPGVVVRNALGNYLDGGAASIVPPNAIRIIGDRMTGDEAYIPINESKRSRAILSEAAGRMGFGLAPKDDLRYLAAGDLLQAAYTLPVRITQPTARDYADWAELFAQPTPGVAGSGALGGGWRSIFDAVKAVIPQARANSTFRPGDPGYHGRGKAVDFGFGSGPGGAGSPGLASINRLLHDRWGRNLAELIYDGIGDDRPDLYRGKPHTYNAGTRAAHQNHVHAAGFDNGGLLPPGLTMAYNGTGGPETVRTAAQESALAPQVNVRVFIGEQELTHIARVEATNVITGLVTGAASGVSYGGPAR